MRIPSPGSVRECMHVEIRAWCAGSVLGSVCVWEGVVLGYMSEVLLCMSPSSTRSMDDPAMSHPLTVLSELLYILFYTHTHTQFFILLLNIFFLFSPFCTLFLKEYKWKFCHYLLILFSFQTQMTYFLLWSTKRSLFSMIFLCNDDDEGLKLLKGHKGCRCIIKVINITCTYSK